MVFYKGGRRKAKKATKRTYKKKKVTRRAAPKRGAAGAMSVLTKMHDDGRKIAYGMIVAPEYYAEWTQPRTLSGRNFPASTGYQFQLTGRYAAAGIYDGCQNWVVAVAHSAFNSNPPKVATAPTGVGNFAAPYTPINAISSTSVDSAAIQDCNMKACTLKMRYHGPWATAQGRIWVGTIPIELVNSLNTLSPTALIGYPNVKEYTMDELLGKNLTVYGSKQSSVANEFFGITVELTDYNVPFILVYGALSTSSTAVDSPTGFLVDFVRTYDYRPVVSTAYPMPLNAGNRPPISPEEFTREQQRAALQNNYTTGGAPILQGSLPFSPTPAQQGPFASFMQGAYDTASGYANSLAHSFGGMATMWGANQLTRQVRNAARQGDYATAVAIRNTPQYFDAGW